MGSIKGKLHSSLSCILLFFSLQNSAETPSPSAHLSGQQLNNVLREITQQNFHLSLSLSLSLSVKLIEEESSLKPLFLPLSVRTENRGRIFSVILF